MALPRKHLQELAYSPVTRLTVKEEVYDRLRALILNGGIGPGRTVTVVSLSEAFGVSAMPVREALHRLVAEKALTIVAGRSVGIPPLTVERLDDLRRVRLAVEGAAIEWATGRLSPAEIAALEGLILQMEKAKREKSRELYVPANREFHFRIYGAAGSETLMSVIESLWLQVGPYFNLLTPTDDWPNANIQHQAMLDALVRKNAAAARAALDRDIGDAAVALKELLLR